MRGAIKQPGSVTVPLHMNAVHTHTTGVNETGVCKAELLPFMRAPMHVKRGYATQCTLPAKLHVVPNNSTEFASSQHVTDLAKVSRRHGMLEKWKIGRQAPAAKVGFMAKHAIATVPVVRQLAIV